MTHPWHTGVGRYGRPFIALGLALVFVFFLEASARAADEPPVPKAVFMPSVLQAMTKLAPDDNAPLRRYGVAAWGNTQTGWLPAWRAGWTLDFSAHAPKTGVAAEFSQVIDVRQKKDPADCNKYYDEYTVSPALTEDGLGAIVKSAPGAVWIVGNEPDRGPQPYNCWIRGQDDVYPEIYAHAYHDVYYFIKQYDPTARVAVAGLVEVTPGRLQYLDKVWEEYAKSYGAAMPVDVWNMHLYILPEALPNGQPDGIANIALGTDPALAIRESGGDPSKCSDPQVYCYAEHDDMTIFAEQVTAMRTWMKQHGQQNKPLMLSEYSLLYPYEIDPDGCFLQDEYGQCFTPDRVNRFMTRTFAYLETAADPALGYPVDGYHLVQRWLWFSTYVNSSMAGSASNLLVSSLDQLTAVGKNFQAEVATRSAEINLLPGQVGGYPGYVGAGSTAAVTLFADVFSNGSISNTMPVQVTFYSDGALTHPIGSAMIRSAVDGCAMRGTRVSVTWPDLPVGTHSFWVKVDNADAVTETSEADNVATGTVSVYGYGAWLPEVFHW